MAESFAGRIVRKVFETYAARRKRKMEAQARKEAAKVKRVKRVVPQARAKNVELEDIQRLQRESQQRAKKIQGVSSWGNNYYGGGSNLKSEK